MKKRGGFKKMLAWLILPGLANFRGGGFSVGFTDLRKEETNPNPLDGSCIRRTRKKKGVAALGKHDIRRDFS